MERTQGARTPYEVYCPRCRVTFPREARRCVHCGGRLGEPGPVPGLGAAASTAGADPRQRPPGADPFEEAELEEELGTGGLLLRRFGGLAMWALLALVALASRLCEQGG